MALFLSILGSYFILLFIAIRFIRRCLTVVTVENVSMSPALEHGDRVLVLRLKAAKWWLRKGLIVLLSPKYIASDSPTHPETVSYIKRIMGLDGETITTSLSDGVKNEQLDDKKVDISQDSQIWHIPQRHLFVCGDNRSYSYDSRAWGPIPLQSVLGVVIMKLSRKAHTSPPIFIEPDHFPQKTESLIGEDAPPFAAKTLNNKTVTHNSYKGRTVLLLFISPVTRCRNAISIYTALAPKIAEAGVAVTLVSSVGMKTTRTLVKELSIRLPMLVAPRATNTFFNDYHVLSTPFYCLVNAQGKIQSMGHLDTRGEEWEMLVETRIIQELCGPDNV